jgi:hypothetical protein
MEVAMGNKNIYYITLLIKFVYVSCKEWQMLRAIRQVYYITLRLKRVFVINNRFINKHLIYWLLQYRHGLCNAFRSIQVTDQPINKLRVTVFLQAVFMQAIQNYGVPMPVTASQRHPLHWQLTTSLTISLRSILIRF